MDILIGALLILGTVTMVCFGPEVVVAFNKEPRRFRRLVRFDRDPQGESRPGRRRNNRQGSSMGEEARRQPSGIPRGS
jgi:hypothetical protein